MSTITPTLQQVEFPRNSYKRVDLAHQFAALPDDGLANTAQTAAFLNCSEGKLERDRWAGCGIPFVQLGRSIRYKKSVVMAHVNAAIRVSTSAMGAN